MTLSSGMFEDSDSPRLKRTKITVACDGCRQRKVKCDGRPTCKNCSMRTEKGIQCSYSAGALMTATSGENTAQNVGAGLSLVRNNLVSSQSSNMSPTLQHSLNLGDMTVRTGLPLLHPSANTSFIVENTSGPATPEISHRNSRKLPSKSYALLLVDEAFRSFFSYFPLFDRNSFMVAFENNYTHSSPDDPSWWACLNAVLALAHIFRAMRTLDPVQENKKTDEYMKNALSVVSELTILQSSLPAIQALVLMTLVLGGTQNSHLCNVLNTAAIRLIQIMGLHRKSHDPNLDKMQKGLRKTIFWIAYFIDKDISLRTGLPPTQDDEDMDTDMPSHSDIPNGNITTLHYLQARIGLAMIQGKVYKRLYSVKGMNQPLDKRCMAAAELDGLLATWKSSVSIDFHGDNIRTPVSVPFLHGAVTRLTYFNTLTAVHRAFHSQETIDGTGPIIQLHCPECVIEARNSIHLIQMIPNGDFHPLRLLMPCFFAATRTLLYNAIQNPLSLVAHSDLNICRVFLKLLKSFMTEGVNEDLQQMYKSGEDLNSRAERIIGHDNFNTLTEMRGEEDKRESVEEFIQRIEIISGGEVLLNQVIS